MSIDRGPSSMDINPRAERKADLRALSKDENEYRKMMLRDISEAKAQGIINEAEAQERLAELRQELGLSEGVDLAGPDAAHADHAVDAHAADTHGGHGGHDAHGADAHGGGHGHGHDAAPATKKTYAAAAGLSVLGGAAKAVEKVAAAPVNALEDHGEAHAPSWFKNGLDKMQDWLSGMGITSARRREGGGGGHKKKDHGHGGHGGGHH